jgi:hypothetical protein
MSDDPTRVRNQPALTSASGNSWLIIGGLFSIISTAMLLVLSTLPPPGLSFVAVAITIALYVAMVVVRFSVHSRTRRLRIIAVCLAAIAFVGLSTVIGIAAVNWAPL